MLKLQHIKLIDENKKTLLVNIDITLADSGFVSIYDTDPNISSFFAQILAGIRKPTSGSLQYGNTIINTYTNQELAMYRSVYVQGLFVDFQLLMNRSVLANICMDIKREDKQIEQLLIDWNLVHCKHIALEDLSFREQAITAILRACVRKPSMLVFDATSSPYSKNERIILYQLLKKLSEYMLVVICGDQECYRYADHKIEIAKTHILSDDLFEMTKGVNDNSVHQRFSIPRKKVHRFTKDINHISRWKFRILSICILISFMCLSVLLFTYDMELTYFEMASLESKQQDVFRILKKAIGNDQQVYGNVYEPMNMDQIKQLETNMKAEQVKGSIIPSYNIYDSEEVLSSLYSGMDATEYYDVGSKNVIEVDEKTDIGLPFLIGNLPQNYTEVAISDSLATMLSQKGYFPPFEDANIGESVIGQVIVWYGQALIVSGVYPEFKNPNFRTIGSDHLFVKKGFANQHAILSQQVMSDDRKMIVFQDLKIMEIDINHDHLDYYFNGSVVSKVSDLKDDEVILNFKSVRALGYENRYQNALNNERLSWDDILNDYRDFAKTLIGKKIKISAYRLQVAPDNSIVEEKELRIKGVELPVDEVNAKENVKNPGVFINEQALTSLYTKNQVVKDVYFYSSDRQQLASALNYMQRLPNYEENIEDSTLFQVFIVDMKEFSGIMIMFGASFLALFLGGHIYLLERSILAHKKEVTTYFLFGEEVRHIKRIYFKNALSNIAFNIIFGAMAGLVCILILCYFIYRNLQITPSVLMELCIPFLLAIFVFVVFMLCIYVYIHNRCIIEESLDQNKHP